jgi:hypothetical protein
MNTIKIRTKQAVPVNPATNTSAHVYLEISKKTHRLKNDVYEFEIRYYYIDNGIEVKLGYKGDIRVLSAAEVNYVAEQITPQGVNYTEVERSYIAAGAFAIVSADSSENWDLTANDWELVNQ